MALGALREVLGSGTLFAGLDLLLGPGFEAVAVDLPVAGMLVFVLPPGAFFGLALLLAMRNIVVDRRAAAKPLALSATEDARS